MYCLVVTTTLLLINTGEHSSGSVAGVEATSPPACPRYPTRTCRGPYTIRPSRRPSVGSPIPVVPLPSLQDPPSPACSQNNAPVMESCLVQCQKDVCCRAFGLDASGNCVTSSRNTEELHLVKESMEPYPFACIEGMLLYV